MVPFHILNFITFLNWNNKHSSITKIVENLFIVRIFGQLVDKCFYFLNTIEMDSDLMSFQIFLNFMRNFLKLLA